MKEDYPVFRKWYKIFDWILDTTEKFPKSVRFTISQRIINVSLEILESIIEAIYRKDKEHILQNINLDLEKNRVFFRISYERKYISNSQYEYIAKELEETGKMVGGWLKSCKE
jgi:four helix bundle protein